MSKVYLWEPAISELLSSNAAEKLTRVVETISAVQQGLYALSESEDDTKLTLLKIGTVFQIFFLETLASGKKPSDLTEDDWKYIAGKVYQHAVLEDGSSYSEFVFTMYANYIDVSLEKSWWLSDEQKQASIKGISEAIRKNTEQLRNNEIAETAYVESCLWLSLEGMIKLLAASSMRMVDSGYAELIQGASQLAFEYGRYRLFKKEDELLERYIQNQQELDEKLKNDYEAYLAEVQEQAEKFQKLIEEAFSPNIHEALVQSAELAREVGVSEEELLTSLEDIDAFFM